MKAAIIYYSYEGFTKNICEKLYNDIEDSDIFQIEIENEKKLSGIKKFAWGGKQVIFKNKPKIKIEKIDYNSYDLFVLASPVWAGSYVPAFRSFIEDYKMKLKGKNIFLIATHEGGLGKMLEKFEKDLGVKALRKVNLNQLKLKKENSFEIEYNNLLNELKTL